MSSSESDIEMKTAIMKKPPKQPKSPSSDILKDPKKLTTKEMIRAALIALHTRKGVSLQAIKKHIVEHFTVDPDRINFYIRKYIKDGVEKGVIVQTKGIGASGSFRLAPEKKPVKKKKPVSEKKEKTEKSENIKKTKKKVDKKEKATKKPELKSKSQIKTTVEETKPKKSSKEPKSKKDLKVSIKETKEPKKEGKMAKKEGKVAKKVSKVVENTPAKKKKNMMKRKSIGSIIKPPKMKPKNMKA